MYERYWLLRERPFDNFITEAAFCRLTSQQAIAEKLRYGLIDRPGCCLLSGMPGTGKTTLLLHWLEHFATRFERVVWLTAPYFNAIDLLQQLHRGVVPGAGDSAADSVPPGRLRDQLKTALQSALLPTLIVLDEAHTLADPQSLGVLQSLNEWCRVARAGTGPTQDRKETPAPVQPVAMLLMGHPQMYGLIEQSPGFREAVGLHLALDGLNRTEVTAYIKQRLQAAGSQQNCFSAAAIDQISLLTGGVVRKINQLADLALLVGYVRRSAVVGPEEVQQAAGELLLTRAA